MGAKQHGLRASMPRREVGGVTRSCIGFLPASNLRT